MADISSLLSRLPGGAPGGGGPMPGGGAMTPARPNIGPVTTPQPHAGNVAAAMNDVRNALRMLEKSLPQIPLGTPLHTEILKATQTLAKHLQPGDGNEGLELQSLLQMARQASQSAPMSALSRIGAPPGAPPAMPGAGAGAEPPASPAPPMPMAA
jgi:hypothetical protein